MAAQQLYVLTVIYHLFSGTPVCIQGSKQHIKKKEKGITLPTYMGAHCFPFISKWFKSHLHTAESCICFM